MLKYIAPSHSLLVLCVVKGMGGSEDEWASALYVYCVCGPVLEENLKDQRFHIALKNCPAEHFSFLMHNPES